MSEETNDDNNETLTISSDVSPTDMMVIVHKGDEYQASDRVEAALAELASALADEEVEEVAGFSFAPGMALDSGFVSSPEPLGIGCIRVGCLRGGGGGGTTTGCTDKVVCRNGYVVITK